MTSMNKVDVTISDNLPQLINLLISTRYVFEFFFLHNESSNPNSNVKLHMRLSKHNTSCVWNVDVMTLV